MTAYLFLAEIRVCKLFRKLLCPSQNIWTLSKTREKFSFILLPKSPSKHLEMDPTYLQFFKTQSYREAPGHALRCTFDGTLKDLLVYFRPKTPKKMFYQKLAIPIHELENKKQIKCTFLSTDQVWINTLFWKVGRLRRCILHKWKLIFAKFKYVNLSIFKLLREAQR